MTSPSGLIIVDKPAGLTSHDVVARIRRIAGTKKVGHAGTLDPMATGVLVVGIEKATRLLGYLTLTEKVYLATIRLGQSTSTDDAEGEVLLATPLIDPLTVPEGALRAAVLSLTGEIAQVPPQVSAIKVNGQRAYKLTRAGAAPQLAARPVTVHEFAVTATRLAGDFLDVDATIRCTSGTYIRSLARDLGAALGTGGPYPGITIRTCSAASPQRSSRPVVSTSRTHPRRGTHPVPRRQACPRGSRPRSGSRDGVCRIRPRRRPDSPDRGGPPPRRLCLVAFATRLVIRT
jgi:tRNA pseudouridine(55) synthase